MNNLVESIQLDNVQKKKLKGIHLKLMFYLVKFKKKILNWKKITKYV